jgi:hypothetical protein
MCYRSRLVTVILSPLCSNSQVGKLSGAFHIDEAFHSYLRFKTKLRVNSLQDSEYNEFILRQWEHGAKRSFSITNGREYYSLQPPSRAYGTFDRLRHKDTLKISK